MRDAVSRRATLQIPWRTLLKIAALLALVWLWLQLVEMVLVLVVAALLAVTLNPVVTWFEARGLSRGGGTAVVALIFVATIGAFLWFTWASLSDQVQYVTTHFGDLEQQVLSKVPGWARDMIAGQDTAQMQSRVADYALQLGKSAVFASSICVVGFILTLYLLVEGRSTLDWLIAFAPREKRPRI